MDERVSPEAERRRGPIIGIGASAGGIDALTRLLPRIAPDSGMSFVVVQHLAPGHASLLAEILRRHSPVPVTQIAGPTSVAPDHVYVIPPNAALTIQDGILSLTPLEGTSGVPRSFFNPIDEFLVSLARDQRDNAACVILSGTGSDGTIGLRAITEHGGLVLAQAEAEHEGMMRSAIATGLVDFILKAEEIPDKLVAYYSHLRKMRPRMAPGNGAGDSSATLAEITGLLRATTGHDFSGYKYPTIIRRVQRRMHVLQLDDIGQFIGRLREDPHEAELLFHDILIGVTSFFRDPQAFAALERQVIPRLFEGKGSRDTVRVWVPGCATGDEAYSIAILLREHATTLQWSPKIQVFASDIDDRALAVARVGRYPGAIAKNIAPARLDRWFQREEGTWRVVPDLHEVCLFSEHDLLADAPFSKLDLISCRNLLIYLGGELRERVIPLFHYALNPQGHLFLGTSENITRHSRLFVTIDKSWRIFRRRDHVERRVPDFPLPQGHRPPVAEPSLTSLAERHLLERFSPPYVIVNAEGDVMQSSGGTGKYLELPLGAPDNNIFSMARPGLRLDLRAALRRAIAGGQMTLQANIAIATDCSRQDFDLYVQPLRYAPSADALFMVVFHDRGPPRPDIGLVPPMADDEVAAASMRQLEMELRGARERLQGTTEELKTSDQELKSRNEELQSINEEMQSANEELETYKEELKSINEELQTVNAELSARLKELSRANNDMSNLLESTQIATVFLDRALRVKSFTPAARDIFYLVASDAGRPILHVRPRFALDELQADAENVLRTLGTIEKPVRSIEGNTLLMMRMLPYRTSDNVINGVVMTFTDITRITEAEARIEELTRDLRVRISELETLLDLVPVGVMVVEDADKTAVLTNTYGARLLGVGSGHKGFRQAIVPLRLFEGNAAVPSEEQPLARAVRTGAPVPGWQGRLEDSAGRSVDVMISATPLFGEAGRVRGAIAAVVDITRHRQAQAKQELLLHELQHRVKNILATVNALAMRMSRSGLSVEAFHDALLSRLEAMGRVHNLLTGGAWSGAALRQLIETALEPYQSEDTTEAVLEGEDIRLSANAATTLGLVFHELATNAAKYGALSVKGGRVHVGWSITDAEHASERFVRLIWTETGGPPVPPEQARGFGTGFVARSLEYELAGSAMLDFVPGGLLCTIVLPLQGNVESMEPNPE